MPELPEIENIRQTLEHLGTVGRKFQSVELRRQGLRTPFPPQMSQKLKGQTIKGISRRAKFLLFETEEFVILSHLGMTGFWRTEQSAHYKKHDHVIFHFNSGPQLILNDTRRFGILDLLEKSKLNKSVWLKYLGIEPLASDFSGDLLFTKSRHLKCTIKSFIMDQKRIVGVGNIYASEALFRAGIRPTRKAMTIKHDEANALVESIKKVLHEAIASGGSTIRDYRDPNGNQGGFQERFSVYNREGSSCLQCGHPVKAKVIVGRNTFWCPNCQH